MAQLTNALLAHKGVDQVIKVYAENRTPFWSKIASVINTRQQFERILQEAAFQPAPAVSEATGISVVDFQTPYFKDYYPIKVGLINYVTTEAEESDILGILARRGPKLLRSIDISMELTAASFLNLATSTASVDVGPDTVALASASHPLAIGLASNILPSNPVLSITSLELAVNSMMSQVDHTGVPMANVGPFVLMVPPALATAAQRLTQSVNYPTANLASQNMAGDKNVLLNRIEVVVNPYFSSTTAWALRSAADDQHGLRMVTKRKPVTNVWNEHKFDTVGMSVTAMFCKANIDWRGFVYSSGTGS